MKVTVEKTFTPVTITLETQDDIDRMYALLNFNPIFEIIAKDNETWQNSYEALQKFRTDKYNHWHHKLHEKFEGK